MKYTEEKKTIWNSTVSFKRHMIVSPNFILREILSDLNHLFIFL